MAFTDILKRYLSENPSEQVMQSGAEDAISGAVSQPIEQSESKPLSFEDKAALAGDEAKFAKRKDIERLLADYDKASKKQSSANLAAGLSEAGMEFGHAFGGQKADKDFADGVRERGGQAKKDVLKKRELELGANKESREQQGFDLNQLKIGQGMDETGLDIQKKEMGIDNEKSMLDPSSQESQMAAEIARKYGLSVPPGASARDIMNAYPMIQEDMDVQKADAAQKAQYKLGQMHEWNQNKRNVDDNNAMMAREGVRQTARENIAGMRSDMAKMKVGERMIPHWRVQRAEDGWLPSSQDHQQAASLSGSWDALKPVMVNMLNLLEQDPRTIGWTDKWNRLKSDFAYVYQGMNKINGNGVMNFGDWEHLAQQIGDPNTMNQWVTGTAINSRLKAALQSGEQNVRAKMSNWKYEPGEEDMSRFPVMNSGGVGGVGGRSGPMNVMSQDDINRYAGAAGMEQMSGSQKTATENGPKSPVQNPVSHGRVKETVTDDETGITYTLYEDGYRTRSKR